METDHPKRGKDIAGERFGKLVVLSYAGRDKYRAATWNCVCDCGNHATVPGRSLRIGKTKSCGCRRFEWGRVLRNLPIKHGQTLNGRVSKIYRTWSNIIQRCNNPKATGYEHYGGRGITVCERWLNFEDFEADVGNPPGPSYEIDRIDNNGNYSPENCHWATKAQQSRNRRNSVFIEFEGKKMILNDWAVETGINKHTLFKRFKLGWGAERALTTRPHAKAT